MNDSRVIRFRCIKPYCYNSMGTIIFMSINLWKLMIIQDHWIPVNPTMLFMEVTTVKRRGE